MELETRQCKSVGCDKRWRCLPTSPNHYCCVMHNPNWEQLASYSFSMHKFRLVKRWLTETMGEADEATRVTEKNDDDSDVPTSFFQV